MSRSIKLILIRFAIVLYSIQAIKAIDNATKLDEAAQFVTHRCNNYQGSFKTLKEFVDFADNFTLINKCLHSIKEPNKLCQDSELACDRARLFYIEVKPLRELLSRYQKGEPICNIEFSSKIYRLHRRLEATNGPLLDTLRMFANQVASRCRKSLSDRLFDVEERATTKQSTTSDAVKHLNLIVGYLNIPSERIDRIPARPELVNPIFQDELLIASRSVTFGRDGFDLKLSEPVRQGLDALRMSCGALKLYHTNLLASIGVLASIGYGISPEELEKLNERDDQRIRIQNWSLAAALCQTLRGILKLSSEKVDGRVFKKVKILGNQEPDLSLDEETDTTFGSFKLPEVKAHPDLSEYNPSRDRYVFDSRQINERKEQLLHGPNFRMVRAIYAYLDVTQREERVKIAYQLLGIDLPAGEPKADNDDDDNEEEEEEEY